MNKIKIAIVEDQALFRNGINSILKEIEDFEVVGTMENGRRFLDHLDAAGAIPDVILADMNMPELNGFELTAILQKKHPSIKIIVLSVFNQERFILKMVEAGVAGYLTKNCEVEEVVLAIRTVHKTGFYFNEGILRAIRSPSRMKNTQLLSFTSAPIELTEREIEIIQLVCRELTNNEIGKELSLSSRTVDWHRNNILAKIGCKNTAGLVLFAVKNNIFEEEPFK